MVRQPISMGGTDHYIEMRGFDAYRDTVTSDLSCYCELAIAKFLC